MREQQDFARAVALARQARGPRHGAPALVFAVILAAGLHGASVIASLGAAVDVPSARTYEVDVMRFSALAALMSTSAALATGGDLVNGGDFESVPQGGQGTECHSTLLPVIPGWNASLGWQSDRFQNTGCAEGCVPPHSAGGNYSISLQGSVCCGCNNNGFIEQTLATVAGRRYRLNFDVVLDQSDLLQLTFGLNSELFAWSGKVQWQTVSREFLAAGPLVLRFESRSPNTSNLTTCNSCWEGEGCLLDNISVVELPPCVADVVENGVVDGADLAALLTVWGTTGGIYPRADTNADGVVDGNDLATVLAGWGACP